MGNGRKQDISGAGRKVISLVQILFLLLLIFNGCSKKHNPSENNISADKARYLKETGRYYSSITIYNSLIKQLDSAKDCIKIKKYQLETADLCRLLGKFTAAESLLSKIDTIDCIDENLRMEYLLISGKILYDTREYGPALVLLERALSISEKISGSNSLQTAECYSMIGRCNLSSNNYAGADKYFNLSFSIKKDSLKSAGSLLISDYMNLGLYHLALAEYDRSLNDFNSAMDIIQKEGGDTLALDKSSVLNATGIVYYQLSDFEKALKYMNDALKIREEILTPSHYLTADIYGNLGMVYLGYAEPEIALDLYEKALNTRIQVFGEQNITVARTYNNLAGVCKDLDKYDKAETYYLKALDIFGKLAPGNLSIGITMGNLADVESHNKNFAESISHFTESISILKKYFGEYHPYTALTVDNLALAYEGMGNFSEAVKYHNEAYKIAEKVHPGKSQTLISQILNELGNIEEQKGNYRGALKIYQNSVANMYPSVDGNNYTSNPSTEELKRDIDALSALSSKANVLYELYKQSGNNSLLELSIQTYNLVDKSIDRIRSGFKEESSRLLLSEKTYRIFNNAIRTFSDACAGLDEQSNRVWMNKAFSFCEKSKALNLLETLIDVKAKDFGGIPDSLLKKEHSIQYRLSQLEAGQYEEQSKGSAADQPQLMVYQNSIFDLKKQYYSLLDNYEKNYPKYYSLKYKLDPVKADIIQKKILNDNDVILEYFLGEDHLFIFIISKKDFELKSLPLKESVSELVNNFRQGLSGNDYKKFAVNSFKLYQALIKPAGYIIKGKNLIIIPDGVLNYIPFDALITAPPDLDKVDYRKLRYLIYDHKISYGYSASLLWENIVRDRSKEANSFVGFAPY